MSAGLVGGSIALVGFGLDSAHEVTSGLILNALFGWWWADPCAALLMTPIIGKEGVEALRGETCCDGGACH